MYFPSSVLKTSMSSTSIAPLERVSSKSKAPVIRVADSLDPLTVPSRPTATRRLPYGVLPRLASRSSFIWASKISVPFSGFGIPPGIRQSHVLSGTISFADVCPAAKRGAESAAAPAVNRNVRLSFFTCFPSLKICSSMAVEEVKDRGQHQRHHARMISVNFHVLDVESVCFHPLVHRAAPGK